MAFPEPSALTGFASGGLDRLAAAREDEAKLRSLVEDPAASAYVMCRDLAVVRQETGRVQARFPLAEALGFGTVCDQVLLGRDEEGPVFGVSLSPDSLGDPPENDPTGHPPLPGKPGHHGANVRTLALQRMLPEQEIAFVGEAKSLLGWHGRHRCCSVCGAATALTSGGWRRECAACGSSHFPRTDPVVIMLAVRGDECLLGRQPRFPKGMYSALAGFLEPGETIENAVRREILEESGVRVGAVAYHASQPWPFPSSLMIGCIAQAVSEDILMDKAELEDCRWFGRSELRAMFLGEHPLGFSAPQPIAIAHLLMRDWLEGRVASL